MNMEARFSKELLRGDVALPDVPVNSKAFGTVAEIREDCFEYLEPVPELSVVGVHPYP